MKTFLFLVLLSLALAARAQQSGSRFTITRDVVAGGGTLSSNVTFSLGSTVGEPIPSSMNTNNEFTIRSGFWVRPAPYILAPRPVGASFVFSLETEPGEVYFAQFSSSLDSALWQNFATITGNGAIGAATNSASGATVQFYRIVQQ